nr:MFS transporter [Agrobacterium vitis]
MVAVSFVLGLLVWHGLLTVEILLGLTLACGKAAANAGPTWPAILPDPVPRAQLRNAVALTSEA